MSQISTEKIEYGGWPNCYRLTNGKVELVATGDVGPRIIRFGFVDDRNEFCEFEEQMGTKGGDEWNIFGGHRLWHSPEAKPRSYYPDNCPVEVTSTETGLVVRQATEATTGVTKTIELRMEADFPQVTVIHKLTNDGFWPVELAPWALSVMHPGGTAFAPQPVGDPDDLLPNRWLVLWPYTDMSDPRVTWGRRFIMLRQNEAAEVPFKFGLSVEDGWAAYARNGHLFVKRFDYQRGKRYPDGGASVEIYTNERMLELETLGPLSCLQPGESTEHIETWNLCDGIPLEVTEETILSDILPVIQGLG